MPKSYRIRTDVGKDKFINVSLEQDFEYLEILSLKILQSEIYTRVCSDYGVIVGRITANNGLGLPNCKVSIFIPLTTEDEENPVISELYPYKSLSDTTEEGYRYNLLPKVKSHGGHTPTGSFPTKDEILLNPTIIEVYDKYYKFTVKTNDSGDFMIFGAPLGTQTLHVDIDLSDIGEFSMSPQDLIRIGVANENQVSGTQFKSSSVLGELPQLLQYNRIIEVFPLWGQPEICTLGITRTDFDITEESAITIQPAAIFMGSLISNEDTRAIKRRCRVNRKTGNLCQLTTGPGEILAIRQTISLDSFGLPILETYELGEGGKVIDDNGTWLVDLPMNLDFVYTNEFGERTFSNDPKKGVPTKAKYRFKVKWEQPQTLQGKTVRRANFLVPNIKEWGWSTNLDPLFNTSDTDVGCDAPNPIYYTFSPAYKQAAASYAFSLDWTDYGETDPFGNLTPTGVLMVTEAIQCKDRFYEMTYNKVYTVAQLISEYRSNRGNKRMMAIRDVLDETCENTNAQFPVNDAQFQLDLLYLLFSILILIAKPILTIILFIVHIVAWVICKIRDLVCRIKDIICTINLLDGWCDEWVTKCDDWNDKCNGNKIYLPSLVYPDCEMCECRAQPPDAPPTPITGALSQVNNSQIPTSLAFNFNTGFTPTLPQYKKIVNIYNGGNYSCTDNGTTGSYDTRTFTMSIPFSEKLNLFNTKAKFFNNDPSDVLKNPGGGVNRIKVCFNTIENNESTNYHFDNVYAMLLPPLPPNNGVNSYEALEVKVGQLMKFSDVAPSSDPNMTIFSGISNSGNNIYGTPSISGLTSAELQTQGFLIGTASPLPGTTDQLFKFNRTLQFANHNITGVGENPVKTVNYTLYVGNEELKYQRFGMDEEYLQVIYTGTVGSFLTQANTAISAPNSFAHRFLNGGMYLFANRYVGSVDTTFCTPISSCNDNIAAQSSSVITPQQYVPNFNNYRIVFMVRGVDPNSTRQPCKYDLSALFGYTLTDSGAFSSTYSVSFNAKLNIPIQPGLRATKHNIVNSDSTDTYSGNKLYFDNFGFTPDPTLFVPFNSKKPLRYSSLDATNSCGAPMAAFDNLVIPGYTNVAYNVNTITVNGTNDYNQELYYSSGAFNFWTPSLLPYNPSPSSGQWNDDENLFNYPVGSMPNLPRNRGYFLQESVEGGSLLYIKESENPFVDQWPAPIAGVQGPFLGPTPNCTLTLKHQYFGCRPSNSTTLSMTLGASGRQMVMRSDRIPVSDNPMDSNPNSSLGGTTPSPNAGFTNTILGASNPSFNVSKLTDIGENDPALIGESLSAADNQENAAQNQETFAGNPNIATATSAFSCEGLVPLECFDVNGAGEVIIKPLGDKCRTNKCCPSFPCGGDCAQTKIMEYGCYVLVTAPWDSRKVDVYLLNEWLLRLRLSFAACRNVWGHMFTNQWVNGTLFAYPIQAQTRFTSPNATPPNQPYSCFCKHLVTFDLKTNNFYYRSCAYNENVGYVGRNNKNSGSDGGNTKVLGNPTTIMDLGPRNDYMDELSNSDSFLGYVMDRLKSTSFQEVDETLNLAIIHRLVSMSTFEILVTSGAIGTNSDPVKAFFSRPNNKVDGDYAQMIAINSQIGVVPYDSSLYTDPNDIFFQPSNDEDGVFGIFFSANTQIRDWLTPKRTIVAPNGDPDYPCTFDEHPVFSQEIPMYLWEIRLNPGPESIFGSQLNSWYTLTLPAGQFNHINYQDIDRTSSVTPYGSLTMLPNQTDNQSYYLGYISNFVNDATDAAYPDVNSQMPSGPNNSPDTSIYKRLINNTAPFYFYFGLIKGSTSYDRFLTKWTKIDINKV